MKWSEAAPLHRIGGYNVVSRKKRRRRKKNCGYAGASSRRACRTKRRHGVMARVMEPFPACGSTELEFPEQREEGFAWAIAGEV